MEEPIQTLLAQLCCETGAVYVAQLSNNRILYSNKKCDELMGFQAVGTETPKIITAHPHLRNLFSCQNGDENSEWEFYDTVKRRMYKLRQIINADYMAVSADDITDVLNLNCAVTDYLRLMNSLSDMQAELIANQDRTLEILMKTLIKQFSAQAVYISYKTRQGELILWSLPDAKSEVKYRKVDRLPDEIGALPSNTIRAADITYEFRIVSPEPPELWNANHAVVMNMAGVYLESSTLREQIKWDNGHDKFTGLYNRAHYIITASERYEKLRTVGVIFIDIDNLKKTNDEQGHNAGDRLIGKAAEVLLSFLSDGIDAYRMGGDEFMLVMCDCTKADTEKVISRLTHGVEKVNEETPNPPLTLSFGCVYSEQARDMEAVIREADTRMYEQKLKHKSKKE